MLFFLSDRIYWIYWIFFSFSQFPEETEKEESRYAGEIKNWILYFLWNGITLISGFTLEPCLAAFGGIGVPFMYNPEAKRRGHVLKCCGSHLPVFVGNVVCHQVKGQSEEE